MNPEDLGSYDQERRSNLKHLMSQTEDDRKNWAKAGYIEPEPEQDNVGEIAQDAGMEQTEREPLHMHDRLVERDEDRYELNPDPEDIPR